MTASVKLQAGLHSTSLHPRPQWEMGKMAQGAIGAMRAVAIPIKAVTETICQMGVPIKTKRWQTAICTEAL